LTPRSLSTCYCDAIPRLVRPIRVPERREREAAFEALERVEIEKTGRQARRLVRALDGGSYEANMG
jgi:hypothetical protein